MGYNAEMTKTIENYDDRPEGLLPFKEEDTLKISHVMILADPIKKGENDLWFKFSMPYGEGDNAFNYEAEAFCLNFTYDNFVKARGLALSNQEPCLMKVTVFEWTNSRGEAVVSMLANDNKLFLIPDLMIPAKEFMNSDGSVAMNKAKYYPPVRDGFRL